MEPNTSNFLNVFKGSNSIVQYYDPDAQPLLPLVELPSRLNTFYDEGVRIYAKMLTSLPAHNVKLLPALNMLQAPDIDPGTTTIVEQSSGSTVISLGIIGRILRGVDDVKALITNKTSESRIRNLRFFGLEVILYGGPGQPDPLDPRGGLYKARQYAAQDKNIINPNQYTNDRNWQSHYRWTGPQILKQLPEINVISIPMGSTGCMAGVAGFLKEHVPNILPIGVTSFIEDPVPGPRPSLRVHESPFPWKGLAHCVEEVPSVDSFRLSMKLSREGLICGPSSGLCLQGLINYLSRAKTEGKWSQLPRTNGTINCVFICCDLPYQYLGDYFQKLDEEEFKPIVNKNLQNVDLYAYNEAWELDGCSFSSHLKKTPCLLLDFRCRSDFLISSVPDATNLLLKSLSAEDPSPFFDAELLERQWRELDALFGLDTPRFAEISRSRCDVMLLCYNGDTSRIATSILRHRGVRAFSLKGGVTGLSRPVSDLGH